MSDSTLAIAVCSSAECGKFTWNAFKAVFMYVRQSRYPSMSAMIASRRAFSAW